MLCLTICYILVAAAGIASPRKADIIVMSTNTDIKVLIAKIHPKPRVSVTIKHTKNSSKMRRVGVPFVDGSSKE